MESAERYREWANVHGHDGRAAAVLQRGWQQAAGRRGAGGARRAAGGARRRRGDGAAGRLRRARLRRDAKAQLAEAKRRHMLLVLFMHSELQAAHAMQRAYFGSPTGAARRGGGDSGWRGRGGRAAAARRRRRRDHDERRRQRARHRRGVRPRRGAAALIIQRHGRLLLGRLTERRAAAIRKVHEDRMAEVEAARGDERAARREREAMLRAEELRAAHDDGAAARRAAEADRALMQRPLQRRALAWPHRWRPGDRGRRRRHARRRARLRASAKGAAGRRGRAPRAARARRHAAALDPEACRFGVAVEGVVWELRGVGSGDGRVLRALSRLAN